ncbi:ROK family protein [Robertmurraya sp. GLU-23]
MLLGGIEAGGTKFVCAVGKTDGSVVERLTIPTNTPELTMPKVIEFFKQYNINSIGIGSFGPVDVNPESSTFGVITSTPKLAWRNFPLLATVREQLNIPVGITTDVNAAALGELHHGAAQGMDSCLYITVGTGIGAGAVVQGSVLQGISHPEMGHILIRRHKDDRYEGNCPYHQDCLEGLASGPAIEARWGLKAEELQMNNEVWELEAYYIAQALMQYILILSPKRIILGGGVMKQMQVFPLIYKHLKQLINDYVVFPEITNDIERYIVSPKLGNDAGITGALMIAQQVLEKRK